MQTPSWVKAAVAVPAPIALMHNFLQPTGVVNTDMFHIRRIIFHFIDIRTPLMAADLACQASTAEEFASIMQLMSEYSELVDRPAGHIPWLFVAMSHAHANHMIADAAMQMLLKINAEVPFIEALLEDGGWVDTPHVHTTTYKSIPHAKEIVKFVDVTARELSRELRDCAGDKKMRVSMYGNELVPLVRGTKHDGDATEDEWDGSECDFAWSCHMGRCAHVEPSRLFGGRATSCVRRPRRKRFIEGIRDRRARIIATHVRGLYPTPNYVEMHDKTARGIIFATFALIAPVAKDKQEAAVLKLFGMSPTVVEIRLRKLSKNVLVYNMHSIFYGHIKPTSLAVLIAVAKHCDTPENANALFSPAACSKALKKYENVLTPDVLSNLETLRYIVPRSNVMIAFRTYLNGETPSAHRWRNYMAHYLRNYTVPIHQVGLLIKKTMNMPALHFLAAVGKLAVTDKTNGRDIAERDDEGRNLIGFMLSLRGDVAAHTRITAEMLQVFAVHSMDFDNVDGNGTSAVNAFIKNQDTCHCNMSPARFARLIDVPHDMRLRDREVARRLSLLRIEARVSAALAEMRELRAGE